ncbi:MAG: Chromosome partition protein Smc [Firmicutes bacterium ADurb.Bin182]|nr:MAG: Chromosome partition protein Smc [Firmicutes bacterium ADurb.Bin182]
MRLTKLEIQGFKSFPQKTVINFDDGITAIIGPNGSGKSNIADAVRWVLGEQSAKTLRGSRMDDVIFNGTQERRAHSYCEVALTLDNSDGELPVDFSEVNIMRRVYRSGESEYYINRSACRLKDISELLSGTGIGKDGYSIIGQGRVDEILSNKSNERRAAFEEAAGVMKYRIRKEEAERKLESTKKNLTRLEDILSELENQLEPLSLQNSAAREYLRLREELKEIEVNIFLYQYNKTNERIASLNEALSQIEEEIASAGTLDEDLKRSCGTEEELERKLGQTISDLKNKLLVLSGNLEAHSGEAKVLDERMTNIKKERERLSEALSQYQAKQAELFKTVSFIEGEMGKGADILESINAALLELEEELSLCESEIEAKEELLEIKKTEMIEALNRISDAKSRMSRADAMVSSLGERLVKLDEEKQSLIKEMEGLNDEYKAAALQLEKSESERAAVEESKNQAVKKLNEKNFLLKNGLEELQRTEKSLQSVQSRLKVLAEMKKEHEGYYNSVRKVLKDCEKDPALKKCVEGVVAELVKVPGHLETAVEMSLGPALQNIVTPDAESAKFVIEHLRRNQYGRATLLPVSEIKPRLLNERERSLFHVDGLNVIGVASDLVKCDIRYRGIMQNLLGRTLIVKDLDTGIAVNRQAHAEFRIATLDGDIINQGGSMTGGSVQKREFSLLGREREIKELYESGKSIEENIIACRKRCELMKNESDAITTELERIVTAAHDFDIELAKQKDKIEMILRDIEKTRGQIDRAELEYSQVKDHIEDIEVQRAEIETQQDNLSSGQIISQEDIREAQREVSLLRAKRDEINEKATQHKIRLTALQKEDSAKQGELKRLNAEVQSLERQSVIDRAALEESERALSGLILQQKELLSTIDARREDINGLTDEIARLEGERTSRERALDEMRERREAIKADINDKIERMHKLELNLNKLQMELTAMQDRIWEEYKLTYENALPLQKQIGITAAHVRSDEIKNAILELGNININAIEDYKIVKQRYESLLLQCEDLKKAQNDLHKLIRELTDTMEKEFKSQFALIKENFSNVFRELFGGGRAELILTDANDVLGCDIDIIAQPPGKKLQLLSLLSGGERALTAIALLFAILKLKPAAFCLLDEIESSLDELNVYNFANYLKRYSEDTQFILITHRKGSMEVCNTLYGVSMEEKGVSKIVSAKFYNEQIISAEGA